MFEKYGTSISTREVGKMGVLSTGFKEPYTMSAITLNTTLLMNHKNHKKDAMSVKIRGCVLPEERWLQPIVQNVMCLFVWMRIDWQLRLSADALRYAAVAISRRVRE